MQWLDAAVISAIEKQVLTPDAIAYTVEQMAKRVAQELRRNPQKPRDLEVEARAVRKELERFMRLIADGDAPQTVLAELKRREERLKELEREREMLGQALPDLGPDEIRKMCGERLARFRELLLGDVHVARQALRKLLPEPLRVFPAVLEGRRTLRFEGSSAPSSTRGLYAL